MKKAVKKKKKFLPANFRNERGDLVKALTTEGEKLVWEAICTIAKETKCYPCLDDIYARVKSKITKRQFPGYLSSLAKKGYIYCFGASFLGDDARDVQLMVGWDEEIAGSKK